MIDYIKLKITSEPESILSNPKLNFTSPVNTDTGEILSPRHGYTKRIAEYEGLKIEFIHNHKSNTKFIELSGSIHKYYQGGKNFTDFTLNELAITIEKICSLIEINTAHTIIHHLEFGVNISTGHKTTDILNSFICYKSKPYELRKYNGQGYYKRFALSQYDVKIYDKGLQYGLTYDLMRFEVKVHRMDYLLKKGVQIRCISDLLKPDILNKLRVQLETTFENLVFMDYRINKKAVTNSRDLEVLLEGSNPDFWQKYKDTHTNKGYHKKKKRFKDLVLKYTTDNLKTNIQGLILAKWDQLNSTPILPSVQNTKVPRYYIHIVGKIEELNKRYCLTCGRNISNQKKGSQYCSEKLNGREVKKCRNDLSNLKQHELRFYKGPTLFDVDQYLKPYYQQLKTILKCL